MHCAGSFMQWEISPFLVNEPYDPIKFRTKSMYDVTDIKKTMIE